MLNILPAKTNLHRSGVNQTGGSPVRDIHAQYPTVTIDGVAAKQSMGGYQKIRMADGTTERLAVYGTIPWLLTIRFGRTTIYKSPRPSFVDV